VEAFTSGSDAADRMIPDGPAPGTYFKSKIHLISSTREVWRARVLVRTLAERDIRVRYKQTVLGFAWAVLMPLILMVVFTVFVKRFAKVDAGNGDVPYAIFAYVGLIPWGFFSTTFSTGGLSLVTNTALLNKVYCPREVFPMASMGVATVDMAIGGVVLLLLFLVTMTPPYWQGLLWLGPELFVMAAFSLGLTLLVAASVVYLRDIRQTIPLLLQFGLFATPVAYSLNGITGLKRDLYAFINPLVATIDGLRQSLLFGEQVNLSTFVCGLAGSITYLLVGYAVFKKLEPGIADVA